MMLAYFLYTPNMPLFFSYILALLKSILFKISDLMGRFSSQNMREDSRALAEPLLILLIYSMASLLELKLRKYTVSSNITGFPYIVPTS